VVGGNLCTKLCLALFLGGQYVFGGAVSVARAYGVDGGGRGHGGDVGAGTVALDRAGARVEGAFGFGRSTRNLGATSDHVRLSSGSASRSRASATSIPRGTGDARHTERRGDQIPRDTAEVIASGGRGLALGIGDTTGDGVCTIINGAYSRLDNAAVTRGAGDALGRERRAAGDPRGHRAEVVTHSRRLGARNLGATSDGVCAVGGAYSSHGSAAVTRGACDARGRERRTG
jgi:hypothetical protein